MNPEAEQSSIRSSRREPKLLAWSEMSVGFRKGPIDYLWLYYTAFYSTRPEGRINSFYVDVLTIWKEPSTLNHEYLVATIKSNHPKHRQEIDGQREQEDGQKVHQEDKPTAQEREFYLLFERTAGKLNRERRREEFLPEKWADVPEEIQNEEDPPPLDRQLEDRIFNATSRRKRHATLTSQGLGVKDASGLLTAALDLASSTSESSSADLLLAEDLFEVIEGPRRQEADQIVAQLQLESPPPLETSQAGTQQEDTAVSERTSVHEGQSMAKSSLPTRDAPIFSNEQDTFRTSRQDLTSQVHQQPSSKDATPRHLSSNDYQRKSVSDSSVALLSAYATTSLHADSPPDSPPLHGKTLSRPSDSGSGHGTPVSPAFLATEKSSGHDRNPIDDFHLGEGSDEAEDDDDEQVEQGGGRPLSDEQVEQDDERPLSDEQVEQDDERPLSDEQVEQDDEQPLSDEQVGQDDGLSGKQVEQDDERPLSGEQVGRDDERPLSDEQVKQDADVPMPSSSALSETHPPHSSHSVAYNPNLHHVPLTRVSTNATNATRSSRAGRALASVTNSLGLRRTFSSTTGYYDSLSISPSRQHIYLYELVVLACRLHKCKSLYRIFTRNCYWFAGMIFHVIQKFTDKKADVTDEEGNVATLGPTQEVHRWINEGRMGTFLRSITVVKAPRMFTIDAVIRKWNGAMVRFRDQIELNRKENRSDADAYIKEVVDAEKEKRREELAAERLEEARMKWRREEERRLEIQREEERKEAERRAERRIEEAREEERKEAERLREEERKEAERIREEERKEAERLREEERRKHEEEIQQRVEAELERRLILYRRASRSSSRTPSRAERPEHGSHASEGEE